MAIDVGRGAIPGAQRQVLRDALGREVALAGRPGRVVSLVPSLTELLFSLGAGPQVAGVSDYCLFPEGGLAGRPRRRFRATVMRPMLP